MSEATGATETQADSGTQPPAGSAQSQADDASNQTQPETLSLEEARKLRAEARSLRTRLKELEDAKTVASEQSQSERDRDITKAKRDGAAEVTAKFHGALRRSGVKSALVTAGVNAELLDLAAKDDVFTDLTVSDEGDVEGIEAAVAALRKARPSLFIKSGDFGGGNRGVTPDAPRSMNDLLRAAAKG